MGRHRVLIVGGGFGGLTCAQALDGEDLDVTLVDRRNFHLFQPLLYQVAIAGLSPAEIAYPIRSVLASQENARVLLGEVERVDLAARELVVDGAPMPYDTLVLAAGARTAYFGNDAWEPFAPGLKSVEDAVEIRRRVLTAFESAEKTSDASARRRLLTFVVVGAGPTGVELAGSIAELARFVLNDEYRSIDPKDTKVVIVEGGPRLLPSFHESLSGRALEQLAELGVEVRTGARVVGVDADGVVLRVGSDDDLPGLGRGPAEERILAATVVWGAGVRGSALAETLGVPLDRAGRVVVEPDCSIPGHPDAFCIGDLAAFVEDGQALPGVSPVAMQQARYVAKRVRARARGAADHPKPFRYFDKGSMATIGRSRAIAEARGMRLSGFVAWLAWLFVHVFYLIGFRNRFVVMFTWFWSYATFRRGARLITEPEWRGARTRALPAAAEPSALPAKRPAA